ncbi:unnamed protein product [Trichobilharzia szidati]|nr:unnamed protein product [Trichobilharzia szidati]
MQREYLKVVGIRAPQSKFHVPAPMKVKADKKSNKKLLRRRLSSRENHPDNKANEAPDSISAHELDISRTASLSEQLEMTGVESDITGNTPLDIGISKQLPINDDAMDTKPRIKLSKSQRKRHQKQEVVKLKKSAKASVPKAEPKEPRTSSSISFPERTGYVPTLDTDEKKLDAVRNRQAEMYQYTLVVRGVPRNCPASVIRDLFPTAVNVRIPYKRNSRYAFAKFRNQDEMLAAQKSVSGKLLRNRPIKVEVCSLHGPDNVDSTKWSEPMQKQLSHFDWRALHVTHLHRATSRFDLAQVFPKAIGIRMPTYDDGSCRGFCTLVYGTRFHALKDFEMRHGTFIHGEPICVNFSLKSKKRISMKNERLHSSALNNMDLDNNQVSDKGNCPKSSDDHLVNMSTDSIDPEFKIDTKPTVPNSTDSTLKKKSKSATVKREISDPLLNKKHQLKDKGVKKKKSTTNIFDSLIQPSSGVNDRKRKKSSKSTKSGKKFKK